MITDKALIKPAIAPMDLWIFLVGQSIMRPKCRQPSGQAQPMNQVPPNQVRYNENLLRAGLAQW
jgi:hypothetical protein